MSTQPYKINGKRVPSVTTVISNCKLGGIEPLLYWANQCGLEGNNHREVANIAANAGTCAHEMIEADIRGTPFDDSKYSDNSLDKAGACFNGYLEWKSQKNIITTHSELSLLSAKHLYGGTMDAMADKDGKIMLLDWKTSNSVYPDYLIQLAAYGQLWNENFSESPINGGFGLLRISKPKEPGDPVTFSYSYWDQLDIALETFLMMRDLYDKHKRLKGFC